MISPFAPVNLPLLEKNQILDENDPNLLIDPKVGKRPYKKREAQAEITQRSAHESIHSAEIVPKSTKKQKISKNPESVPVSNHDQMSTSI